jgi:AraC family transcriptional regulator
MGALFFVPYGVYLHGRTSGGLTRGAYCEFDRDWFERLTGLGHDWSPEMLAACVDIKNPWLAQAMTRLGREATAPGFACAELTSGLATLVAVELARHLRSVDAKRKSTAQQLTPWQMRKITHYVENLAGYAPDVEEVADLCGVSSRHLRRLFKQTTDQTIYEYARDVWAAKAKQLLSDTDLPLKEIWSRMGFASPSSFSVAFSRATGVSPKAFRQRFHQPRRGSHVTVRSGEALYTAA